MAAQSRPPILITRPEPQASRLARQLRAQDWAGRVHVAPLMVPAFLPVHLPQALATAIILTSETAAIAAAEQSGRLPHRAWCVGDRTARVARARGFDAISAKGDSAALVQAIIAAGQTGPLLYLHGRETTGDVAGLLNSAGIETHSAQIYAQEPRPLSLAARRLIGMPGPVILPVYSPRSARLLVREWLAAGPKADPWPVALSPAIAEALSDISPKGVTIAARSESQSMLAALKDLIGRAPWA